MSMTTELSKEFANMVEIADYYNNSNGIYGFIQKINEMFEKFGFKSEMVKPMGLCVGKYFRCVIGQRGLAEIERKSDRELVYPKYCNKN